MTPPDPAWIRGVGQMDRGFGAETLEDDGTRDPTADGTPYSTRPDWHIISSTQDPTYTD